LQGGTSNDLKATSSLHIEILAFLLTMSDLLARTFTDLDLVRLFCWRVILAVFFSRTAASGNL
jgi:hypothetical protein